MLFFAAAYGLIDMTYKLLCRGEIIDEKTFEFDQTQGLLRSIHLQRTYTAYGTQKSNFSPQEIKVFQALAYCLAQKSPSVAFRIFIKVRSLITYNGVYPVHSCFANGRIDGCVGCMRDGSKCVRYFRWYGTKSESFCSPGSLVSVPNEVQAFNLCKMWEPSHEMYGYGYVHIKCGYCGRHIDC
jgi:hypothetical protein